MRTMLIRRCRLDDARAVAELATELGYPTDAAQAAARLACLLGRAEDAIFAAEDAGAVVGWLHAREMRELESEPCGEIAGLVVAAPRRGQGFGKALVQAALAWAAERGLATLRVRSNVVRQDTHRWYQAAGFKVLKTQAVFSRSTTILVLPLAILLAAAAAVRAARAQAFEPGSTTPHLAEPGRLLRLHGFFLHAPWCKIVTPLAAAKQELP